MKRSLTAVIFALSLPLFGMLSGCTTTNPYTGQQEVSKTTIGAGAGAVGGALVGQLIGHNTASTLVGAGIGAMVGGVAGNYMDHQANELRAQLQGSGVQVVKYPNGDVKLIMPGDITFQNDRADIRPEFYNVLNSVAIVLNKFNRTNVKIAGYASKVGSPEHNQILSEQRAHSVASYLISQHIDPNRIMAVGYGSRYPVASNATREGQAQNRRVEITLHQLHG